MNAFARQDSRIIVVDQKNAGPARARNRGLEKASGAYVMFCDADDGYAPTMCTEMVDALEKNRVDFAMCGSVIEDEVPGLERDTEMLSYYHLPHLGFLGDLTDEMKSRINVVLWNKIFRKSLIDAHHISFPDGCLHDDDAFLFQYLAVARTAFFLDRNLYHYLRRASGSIMSRRGLTDSTDRCKIMHLLWDWLSREGALDAQADSFLRFYFSQFWMCCARLRPESYPAWLAAERRFWTGKEDFYRHRLPPRSRRAKTLRAVMSENVAFFKRRKKRLLMQLYGKLFLKHLVFFLTFRRLPKQESLQKTQHKIRFWRS